MQKEKEAAQTLAGLSGNGGQLGNLLSTVEQFVYYLGLGLIIVFIILATYKFFFSAEGSKKATEDAQKSLSYAIIALVVLILLRTIFIILAGILGFQLNSDLITK